MRLRRRQEVLTRPDGTTIEVKNPPLSEDVDTNCLFFLEGSSHSLHHWVTIPRQLSAINDRVVVSALKNYGLRPARVKEPTVFYECLWSSIYQSVGEVPPPNAKPNVDPIPIYAWLDTLPDRELTIASRRSGLPVRPQSRMSTSSGSGVGVATGRPEFALSLRIGQKIQTLSRTDSLGLTRWAGVCSQRCLPGTGKRAGELPSCAHKKQQAAKPSPDPGFRRRCPEKFKRYLVQILDGAGSGWPLN